MGLRESFRAHQDVHLKWTIFVLALIVIGLTSMKLGTNEGVKDLLTFALSFSSLILAIIAIVQSLLSNSTMAETNTAVTATLREMQGPANQISEAARQLTEHSTRIEARTDELSRQISTLNSTQGTSEPPRNDLASSPPAPNGPLTAGGLVALYVVKKSNETNAPLDTAALANNNWSVYTLGFVAALRWMNAVVGDSSGTEVKISDLKTLENIDWKRLFKVKNAKAKEQFERYRGRVDQAAAKAEPEEET